MSTEPIVAFQGEHGAYSEQAAIVYFGTNITTKPCRTIKRVFDSVEDGSAYAGIIPAENSLEGSVNQTYDLLLESQLRISGEVKVRVNHCLLALLGTRLEDLRVVYSHPQALAQCRGFLEKLHVETEPTYDTAGSAKIVKEKAIYDAAAIASEKASELYGLTVLRRNIEDHAENFTRFFIVGLKDAPPTGRDNTTAVFGTRHTPGSLHKALGELASRGINLTKIESRPIKGTPWEYHFFIEFEGHCTDRTCAEALEALRKSTTTLRILGSYRRAD